LKLAERFFSAGERAELSALPPAIRPQAFFLGWTRKEAFIKAHGEGLSLPLDHFDVSLTPGEPARLEATRAGLEAPDQWSLINLEPAPDYLAALAVRGRGFELHCWTE
jgi:4'-phosphopantetheinyl transferase